MPLRTDGAPSRLWNLYRGVPVYIVELCLYSSGFFLLGEPTKIRLKKVYRKHGNRQKKRVGFCNFGSQKSRFCKETFAKNPSLLLLVPVGRLFLLYTVIVGRCSGDNSVCRHRGCPSSRKHQSPGLRGSFVLLRFSLMVVWML